MVTMLSLFHGFLNGMQDFGMAVKIFKVMNSAEDQWPFERLT
jgi:hypothetical protein